ncbi:Protein of unknown function [Gryllus bimaculatus]|nr:Protein of unknown function [Gryllus bimaculatus]
MGQKMTGLYDYLFYELANYLSKNTPPSKKKGIIIKYQVLNTPKYIVLFLVFQCNVFVLELPLQISLSTQKWKRKKERKRKKGGKKFFEVANSHS